MSSPDKATAKPADLNWINNLRLVALFAVIILHTTSPLLETYNKGPLNLWLVGDFYNSLVRFAVPVFVMITGALLLPRDYDLVPFLKKRITRVGIPFLFWTFIYIGYSYYNEELPYTGDTWLTVKQILHQLKFGASYHLWYVYMLLGLYFVIPVIGKFVRNATDKEIRYFLIMWLIVMLISQPYMTRFDPHIDLHYFAGYLGYLVLGHYLATRELTAKNLLEWMIPLFLLTLITITTGTYALYHHYNGISTLLYEPLSPAIVLLSSTILIIARLTAIRLSPAIMRARNFISDYNYGIYLGHALVLTLFEEFDINYKIFNPLFSIPLIALACMILTLLLVFSISKIPFVGKWIAG